MTTDYRTCKADEFRCDSGQCIPLEFKCKKSEDERMGCVDKSHLKNCRMLILNKNRYDCIIYRIIFTVYCIPKYF